jgi:hypothetical protein
MKQHSEYIPLDVETNPWPGFKSIQEFEQERGVRTCARGGAQAAAGMLAILVVISMF